MKAETDVANTQADIQRAIEAILMVADQPVSAEQISRLVSCDVVDAERACSGLIAEYERTTRGFVMQKVAGGYRFQSHPDLAPVVEQFVLDGQAARLSAAALETMAIIAYKQPISRNQISSIRGVNAEGVVRTLEARGYVEEISRDPGPGRASLYGTTMAFLERLGLNSLEELPPLGQFVPGTDVVEALEHTLLVNPESSGQPALAEGELPPELSDDWAEDQADAGAPTDEDA